MRVEWKVFLAMVLFVFLMVHPFAHVYAADDSNSGQLAQDSNISPQALDSALTSLAQGTNDPQMQTILNQFESQLSSANYNGAVTTLLSLQTYSKTHTDVPGSLNSLLQSLSVGQNGAYIDPSSLANLLGSATPNSQGAPSKVTNESPAKLSIDLQTLANLLQYVDPNLASELLRESSSLSGGQNLSGNNGKNAGIPIAAPGLPSSIVAPPPLSPPTLAVGSPMSVPSLNPTTLAVPMMVAILAAALFVSRGKIAKAMGAQLLPGLQMNQEEEASIPEGDPNTPRGRVMAYFAKTVRLMGLKGVPKQKFETHREFSDKCNNMPESPSVSTISSLYEKAKFSGQDVTSPDVEQAVSAYSKIEKDGK